MSTLARLVRACHPEPTAAVTVICVALAASTGLSPVAVGAAVLTGQLSVGWSNDWIDADRDRAVQRTDKPVVQGLEAATLRTAALLALAACVPLSLLMGGYAGAAHLVAVASAWAYNARLKSTALSFLPFALSFGLVPAVMTLGQDGHPLPAWWATGAGALLGVGAHAANVLPDLDDDRATGVQGLPHRLGRQRATLLAGASVVGATVLLALGPGWSWVSPAAIGVAVVAFGGGLVLARRPGSRAAFLGVLAVAVLDVALLLLRGDVLAT